tara:strand:- start:613 stop:1533 length:921 start_codon:yes stop_codon:yes gene_type:complete
MENPAQNSSQNNQIANRQENTIDVKELIGILWKKKYLISSIITLSAIVSVLYALYLPNIYTSKVVLLPINQNDSLSSKLGGYSALAGFAGINLSSGGADSSTEAMERIKSYNFFINYFLPNIKLQNLHAVDRWEESKDTFIYDFEVYDQDTNKWNKYPSSQESYKEYKKILNVSEDKLTKFVTVSIDHQSPFISKGWVEIIIKNINEQMRQEDRQQAINSINFLTEYSQKTNPNEIKEVIAQLLASQMQNLMLTSSNENYVFRILDFPIAPETKSAPSRALICFIGVILGGLLAIALPLAQHYFKE